jgi:hypothetical protein
MANPWWKQEKKSARKLRAMAVVNYALARRYIDQARHAELLEVIPNTPHLDVPELVGDLPVPRWDRVPLDTPVDRPERDFAVALLDVAHQAEALNAADRKWRKVFAVNARTAGDLLVLILDAEPYLRDRRQDPALAPHLARLAFVQKILQVRSRGRLSRAEFDSFLERTASGESLDSLRAELDVPDKPKPLRMTPRLPEPPLKQVTPPRVPTKKDTPLRVPTKKDRPNKRTPVAKSVMADPPVTDVDRARIAKHLERALLDERLDPGEHAARTLALLSATTARELARLVVDIPVPANEPLRDRKPNSHLDDLISPAHRQAVVDRLNRAVADHALSLWEYETRLDAALKARTFEELGPATADLPPDWSSLNF